MNNRTFILPIVIVLAIAVGVLITVQKVNSPVMVRLITQQNEILKMNQVIQRQLMQLTTKINEQNSQNSPSEGQANKANTDQFSMEARVSALEKRIVDLTNMVQKLSSGQAVQQVPQRQQEDYSKVYKLDAAHSPVKGNPSAPITIVEFMDIQCPYCSRFHPVVDEVLAAYPDKVNFILKNFPLQFHSGARPAAKAAFAAGEQGKYHEMIKLLLDNNRELTENKFKELAGQLGLNVEKFMNDLKEKDAQYEGWIQQDIMLATQSDVRGTPTFFLGGRKTTARDLGNFKTQIDALLKQ
ncbi:MAG: thioredoxin domain-containing protein [Candidatus Omnitrophota bacterium]|jgi:protein-disulfide isomerase